MNDIFAGLERPEWAIDPAEAAEYAGAFIREVLEDAGVENLVIGLSGGIDSAVSAGLAVRALGPDRVRGFLLPYTSSSAASITDAEAVAETLGIRHQTVPIAPMAEAFLKDIPAEARVRRGNVMARCRMIVLYDRSAAHDALVLGTGNRTEALLGYTTLYGDNACALNPVGQLYKTEIRLLAAWLGLPRAVLDKAPSADLWEGQADEDELGFSYAQADVLLHAMVDEGRDRAALTEMGFAPELIDRVAARVRAMRFKRQTPPIAAMPGRPDPDAAGGFTETFGTGGRR